MATNRKNYYEKRVYRRIEQIKFDKYLAHAMTLPQNTVQLDLSSCLKIAPI